MDIKITDSPISISEISRLASQQFGNLVKAAVDIEKSIIALGGELHADEEQALLEAGSKQGNLWGINLYPDKYGTEDFIEFDSMINIRPSQHNLSRGVEDVEIKKQIYSIVDRLVVDDNELKNAA